MFSRSARFYDLIYSFKDYAAEAARVSALIRERRPDARTLLDVACGTGAHLEHLAKEYMVEGLDLDDELLVIAGERLPGVPLHSADMRSFDLGRTFDAVTCLFSAIGYVRGVDELRSAAAAMGRHLAPGGALVVEPWFSPGAWEPGHIGARFVDEPDLKIVRLHVSEAAQPDGSLTLNFHYLVATRDGVEHFTEEHVTTLFTREQYLDAFGSGGLDVAFDPDGLMPGRGLILGVRPR
jgi:ubiquinone/menaquinone biosynthesis C-methylase UbiE